MLANYPPIEPSRILGGPNALREVMNQLYETGVFPPADLYLADDQVLVEFALPGADPDDFEVSATDQSITITGEIKREPRPGQPQFESIWRGPVNSTLNLPVEVDPDEADASFRAGVLRVTLPRVQSSRSHVIRVRNEDGAQTQMESSTSGTLQTERVPVQR